MKSAALTIALAVFAGMFVGLGLYTFVYAKGYSYMTNNPEACVNCHVMNEHFDGWVKSSHRSVAACNDCHTPHNFFGKYAIKATNGFFHSLAFTSGNFPDNIQIKGYNRRVTESACRDCHQQITAAMVGEHAGENTSCIKCHGAVGHSASAFMMESLMVPSTASTTDVYKQAAPESSNGNPTKR